jgi:hypothetical protein
LNAFGFDPKYELENKHVTTKECWFFHDKASGFFVQLVVPPKSTVGFVSNLNQF